MAFAPLGVEAVVKNLGGFTRDLGKMDSAIDRVGQNAGGLGGKFNKLGQSVLGFGLTAAKVAAGGVAALGAGLVALGVSSVKTAADFEAQIAILSTAVDDASVSMDTLQEAALAVGADTSLVGVTASQAAESMTGLYKAGLTTTDIFGDLNSYLAGTGELSGALRAAVDLQAASELDLASASELVAVTMATFGLSAEEATRISNNFVQAADASVANVADLGEALKNVGPTAATFGFSLEDTNNALAILSTRGISGAEAGTSLKSMLVNIMRPTADVKTALDELGISLYDAEGTMRSLPEIVAQLAGSMEGLTDEQRNQYVQTLAGTYGMKALQTLLEEGVTGWDAMASATGAASTASEIARARTATFKGAMEALAGVVETLKIRIGNALLPVLTELAKGFADFINQHGPALTAMFEKLAEWLATNIPVAIQTLSNFWTGTLLPAIQDVWNFFSTNILPLFQVILPQAIQFVMEHWEEFRAALIAIGGFIAVVATVTAIGAAITALANPITLVVAAVGLLAAAWQSNFLGIRDTLTEFWTNTAQPALAQLYVWLKEYVPVAIQILSDYWQTVLLPALRLAWAFLNDYIIPVLSLIFNWLAENVPSAIQTASDFWQTVLLPAITAIYEFTNTYLVPLFQAVAELLRVTLVLAVETIANAWQNVLLPALDAVWVFINEKIIPVFGQIREAAQPVIDIINTIVEKFNQLTGLDLGKIVPDINLQQGFEGAKTALGDFTGGIEILSGRLAGIKPPTFLDPGSPTPFELGLTSIANILSVTLPEALLLFSEQAIVLLTPVYQLIVQINAMLVQMYTLTLVELGNATLRTTTIMINAFQSVIPILDAVNAVLGQMIALLGQIASAAQSTATALTDGFRQAVDVIKDNLIPALEDTRDILKDLKSLAEEAAGAVNSFGNATPGGVPDVLEGQRGLDFVVPPGFPRDTFPMRVSSGERVVVIPRGQPGNAGGGTVNNSFNMTVHTAASGGTVYNDFETMRALIG